MTTYMNNDNTSTFLSINNIRTLFFPRPVFSSRTTTKLSPIMSTLWKFVPFYIFLVEIKQIHLPQQSTVCWDSYQFTILTILKSRSTKCNSNFPVDNQHLLTILTSYRITSLMISFHSSTSCPVTFELLEQNTQSRIIRIRPKSSQSITKIAHTCPVTTYTTQIKAVPPPGPIPTQSWTHHNSFNCSTVIAMTR